MNSTATELRRHFESSDCVDSNHPNVVQHDRLATPLDKNCRLTRRHRINACHKCHWPNRLCVACHKCWPNFQRKNFAYGRVSSAVFNPPLARFSIR